MRVVMRQRVEPGQFYYEKWRHGGWYVLNVRYPNGAIGCVSRNYADKKWRVVCAEHLGTFRTRDEAAAAEQAYAKNGSN